ASSEAFASDGDCRFAAGDDTGRWGDGLAGGRDLASNGAVHAGDVAGFAFDGAGENPWFVAEFARGRRGGVERLLVVADDLVFDVVEVLWSLDERLRRDAVFAEDSSGGGDRGQIGRGGAGGDDVEVVAYDIGQDEAQHMGWGCHGGELAALDCREMLAH